MYFSLVAVVLCSNLKETSQYSTWGCHLRQHQEVNRGGVHLEVAPLVVSNHRGAGGRVIFSMQAVRRALGVFKLFHLSHLLTIYTNYTAFCRETSRNRHLNSVNCIPNERQTKNRQSCVSSRNMGVWGVPVSSCSAEALAWVLPRSAKKHHINLSIINKITFTYALINMAED